TLLASTVGSDRHTPSHNYTHRHALLYSIRHAIERVDFAVPNLAGGRSPAGSPAGLRSRGVRDFCAPSCYPGVRLDAHLAFPAGVRVILSAARALRGPAP